jgi:hypothetical protein
MNMRAEHYRAEQQTEDPHPAQCKVNPYQYNVCRSRGESKTKFTVNIKYTITSTIYVTNPLLNRAMHHITT